MKDKLIRAFSRAPLILKFITIAVPLTLLATVLTFAFIQNNRFQNDIEIQDGRIARLARIEAQVLSGPVWNFHQAQIDLLIYSVINDPDLVSISVHDDADRVLGSIEAETASRSEPILLSAPIKRVGKNGEAEEIGRLDFQYTRDRLNQVARQQVLTAVLITILLAVAVIVSALIAFHFTVLKPLNRFGSAMDEAQSSNEYVPVDWDTGDEIGRVASAYNELQRKQKRDEGELREIRDNLEILVDERTGELKTAVAELTTRESELIKARDDIQLTFDRLKQTRDRLVQAEKMASLGQLTAGIAHEIKNPLNFVNNFSSLSVELLGELQELIPSGDRVLTADEKDDLDDLSKTLSSNLEKICEHGNRADTIVRNMLVHSRSGPTTPQLASLVAVVDEALKLSYHSSRAELQDFNIAMDTDYDNSIGEIECYAQDLSRVFINIISNGMYATHAYTEAAPGYEPKIKISTKDLGDTVEIVISDNGPGLPSNVADQIFTPFFTTKPAGEGTGLGLSISYDIVVTQHGGDIRVIDGIGDGAGFQIRIPKSLPKHLKENEHAS